MSLTILNTIIDEEIARPGTTGTLDEHDVSTATFDASTFKTALTTLAIPAVQFLSTTGFPQYAEKTSFVSSSNPVTDYFLTGSATGTPLSASGTATLLKVGDTTVFLFPTSNPDIVVGRVGTEGGANPDTANASGAIAFIIGIEETKTGGFVTQADMWIALYSNLTHNGVDAIDSADQLDLANLVYLGSSFDTTTNVGFENFDGVPSGNNLFNVIFPSDGSSAVQLLLTGSAGAALSTVNVSTTGIGAGSQHVDVNATLRIDTVQGMVKANVDAAPEVNQAGNIAYTDTGDAGTDARVELVGADFEITQVNPGSASARVDIRLSAFNVAGQDQGQTYLNNINSNGTAVVIDAGDIIVKNGAGQDITSSLTIIQDPLDANSVIIRGLDDGTAGDKLDGYQVFFTTDGVRFDRMLITNIDPEGSTFDVGNIHVTAVEGGSATEFAELGSRLKFQDDGPLITASGATLSALTVDDSTFATDASASFAGLFNTPNDGADAPASVGYTLGVTLSGGSAPNSGLVETATGDSIFLFLESGIVRGRSGDNAGAAASGPIVFEISVNSSGVVTLDQKGAVFHTDSNNHDSTSSAMTAGLITLSATVSDSEPDATDDSASASANIGDLFLFKDDGPALTPQAAGSGTPNNLEVPNGGSDSSSYGLLPGADGQATNGYTIVGPADSTGTYRWAYDNASLTSITGTYVDALNASHNLYTLSLNQSTGAYTFNMTGTLPSSVLNLSTAEIKAGAPNTNSIQVGAIENDDYVVIAGGGGAINESNGFVGVKNGNLDVGESLTFQLWDGTPNPDVPINFQGLIIGTKSAQASSYNVHIDFLDPNLADLDYVQDVAKNTPIVIDPNGDSLIQSITLTKASGPALKIGVGDIDILVPPVDIQLGFAVRLTDGDGDFTDQSFTVDIDGNLDGVYSATTNALSLPLGADTFSAIQPLQYQPQDYFMMQ